MRTDVYSWRLSPERKAKLAAIARREGTTIAKLLETATDGLLVARDRDDQAEQAAWQARVARHVGVLRGTDPAASAHVREGVRQKLLEKHRQGRL